MNALTCRIPDAR